MEKKKYERELLVLLEKELKKTGMESEMYPSCKTNMSLQSVAVKKIGSNVGAVIDPEQYFQDYENGQPLEAIVKDIVQKIYSTLELDKSFFDEKDLTRENAETHLRALLVNYEKNKDWLDKIPHRKVADLAVCAKWFFPEGYSMKITYPTLNFIGLDTEKMLEIAIKNTASQYKFRNMKDVMNSYPEYAETHEGKTQDIYENPFYVLSVADGYEGAAVILDTGVIDMVRAYFQEDFYIVPSSIHETLLVRKSEISASEMRFLTMSVNMDHDAVSVGDWLSDNIYEYDGAGIRVVTE